MKTRLAYFAALAALPLAAPFAAHASDSSTEYYSKQARAAVSNSELSAAERESFAALFAAIDRSDWDRAYALVETAPRGPMHAMARAELYLAAGSPVVELGPLLALIHEAPWLPQAEQLGRLAAKRGATILPNMPQSRRLSYYGSAPRREKPADAPDPAAAALRDQIVAFIKNDDPWSAERLIQEQGAGLSAAGRTELEQRVSWSYYIENDDASALRLANIARRGVGEWTGHADWVAGLAAWRMDDCASAAQAFDSAGRTASNADLRAAGLYWASRALTACGQPQYVEQRLRAAAELDETFYGQLAAEALGIRKAGAAAKARLDRDDAKHLEAHENVRVAVGLVEIGEEALADEVLRHQARIGDDRDYDGLLALASDLGLPRTQLSLAHYGPAGRTPPAFARYPAPRWMPERGWRVDPALIFAHSLQESGFAARARSSADARGLMQVRPATARDIARSRGETVSDSDLYHPTVNLEYGQSYLEMLRDMPQTGGLLPKIIAAYNAGPGSVQRWNSEIRDKGDPLLFMESIPYSETRAYVGIIFRNYWLYESQAGAQSISRHSLAQNLWPRFPSARSGRLASNSHGGN